MAASKYGIGFSTGRMGCVGRPPYDPRDPLTMQSVNEYNRGYVDGCRARMAARMRLGENVVPRMPRNGR